MTPDLTEKKRKRAPSQRSLETRRRIFDAAEHLFSARGFEGASIRDIAARAGVQAPLVHHHGGSKEALFNTTVARRATELSQLRLNALAELKVESPRPALRDVLACFLLPFLDKVIAGEPGWSDYGRLVAYVSADPRWRKIAQACFDPTAEVFLTEIGTILPDVDQINISARFTFMVSAMLSLCTSRWRIETFAPADRSQDLTEVLLDFCCAGFTPPN